MWDWDEDKRRRNAAKHGVDFAAVARFDWASAVVEPDRRRDYGEARLIATGLIGDRLHILIFTRRGGVTRVISLRKANSREVARWLR
ncbi:MAG: BrnT family toxin [Rhodobacteraceae bacterium]|nr:BrnT family toxin [Paracoccaceae bacterium]